MRLRAWLIHLREWLRVCVGNLRTGNASTDGSQPSHERLRADGGETRDEDDEHGGVEGDEDDGTEDDEHGGDEDEEDNEGGGGRDDEDTADVNRSNVEVTEAGETSPADPKWEKPDPDDLPEFELRADEPAATGSPESEQAGGRGGVEHIGDEGSGQSSRDQSGDPTAGMPNAARSPGETRIKEGGAEGYVVAVEICARLPDDVRLPEEAADLVPAAVEAELEQSVQGFAAAEFDNDSPHVDTLSFVERDGEVWFQLRLGVPPGAFSDLDPGEIRAHALQQLEGMF